MKLPILLIAISLAFLSPSARSAPPSAPSPTIIAGKYEKFIASHPCVFFDYNTLPPGVFIKPKGFKDLHNYHPNVQNYAANLLKLTHISNTAQFAGYYDPQQSAFILDHHSKLTFPLHQIPLQGLSANILNDTFTVTLSKSTIQTPQRLLQQDSPSPPLLGNATLIYFEFLPLSSNPPTDTKP